MINLRTRKVLRDLWVSKSRVALIVISIAVGLFAMSTVFRAQAILARDFDRSFQAINPASATLFARTLPQKFVDAIEHMPQVEQAQGRRVVWSRLRVGDEWRLLKLSALPDFDDLSVNKIVSAGGEWPPPERTLLIERSSLTAAQLRVGQTVRLEAPNGREREMQISGAAHDLTVISGELVDQAVYGYISLETLDWLGLSRDFNEVDIVVGPGRIDREQARQAANRVSSNLEQDGQPVLGVQIPKPGKPPMDNVIRSLLLILGALGSLSLVLSGLLVFNTISAYLARQTRQIGIMKAIGAPQTDILAMYLVTILVFGLLALFISIPLGILGARLLTAQLAHLLNFDIQDFSVPPRIFALEILIGLAAPLVVAIFPVLAAVRTTVRQAVSGAGGGSFGTGALDRWVARLQGLPASLLYATRNIFRRKVRLALTLVTLSLGGAIFITVLSLRASMFLTINDIAAYWQQDVSVDLQRPYRTAKLAPELLALPGVSAVEGWQVARAFRVRPDGLEANEQATVFAAPAGSRFVRPTLLQGRWLVPGDEAALVINVDFAAKEPDIQPGDRITLKIDGRESAWQVVGISTTQMVGFGESTPEIPMAYANYDYFSRVTGGVGRANRLAIATGKHDDATQLAAKRHLESALDAAGVRVRNIDTYANTRRQVENLTGPLLLQLAAMAVLFAAVGGLSLMGTMSLNVLERTQEIGILRSVGATSGIVQQVVIAEGVVVGLVSWLLASLLAWPFGKLLSVAVGMQFVKTPLVYDFAPLGILLWLGVVLLLAVVSSYIPARNASRLSVREVLTYE